MSTDLRRASALKSLLDIENDILEAANHIKDTQAGLVEGVLESKTIDPLMDAHERIHEVRRALAEAAVPETVTRKYEEPTEAMVHAGAESLCRSYVFAYSPRLYRDKARACFKAMMEAEDESHE